MLDMLPLNHNIPQLLYLSKTILLYIISLMAHTALICIWYRHCLSGLNTFDTGIILSWHIKDMRCDIIHPVILVVFACQALPESSACLHGLYCMAVNAVYYAFFSKAYFVLHMFLYATIL